MNNKKFFTYLCTISLFIAILLSGLYYLGLFKNSIPFTVFSMLFFVIWSIAIYFGGKSAAQSKNKNTFTSAILLATFSKLFLCLFIIVAYDKIISPIEKEYLFAFLILYVFYTVFETYFMTQLAKIDKNAINNG